MKKVVLMVTCFCISIIAFGQSKSISGTVTSEDGEPIIGATIREAQNPSNGTITDIDGSFSLEVTEGNDIIISSIGYGSKTMSTSGESSFSVSLESGVELDEVVVTALGISREKRSLGYAVTEIKGDDVSTVKEQNVVSSLAGRVAGVNITQNTSGPAGGVNVVIRGNSSLTGSNQPLYVVDGIPINNTSLGGTGENTTEYSRPDYGSGISDINPDDIESMTVLKGPNAAALYGSRASNGVILITTKSGVAQKGIGVSLSSNFTADNPLLLPAYQNQYGQGSSGVYPIDLATLKSSGGSWGPKLDGSSQLYYTGQNQAYSAQADNVKNFFQTANNWVNTLALQGGGDKGTMRFSYTYNTADGLIPSSELRRHNFNIRGNSQLTDRLSVDAKATYFQQEVDGRIIQGTEGIMANLYNIPRNIANSDLGNFQNDDLSVRTYGPDTRGNPYWAAQNDVNQDNRDRIQGFAKANYQITDNLSAFARVGTDVINQKTENINQFGHWFYGSGRFIYNDYRVSETNADFLLTLENDFTEDLNLVINGGGSHSFFSRESSGVVGSNFKIPSKATVASASILTDSYTPTTKQIINSVYGTASFGYKDILYLDLTGRNDWNSSLSPDNWSFFYPSASASFIFDDLLNLPALDFGKLRASYAKVGNGTGVADITKKGDFYILSADGYLGRTTLSRPDRLVDENINAEFNNSFEIGTELNFFNGRLFTDISYYNITGEDVIIPIPVDASTGYEDFLTNVGKITNNGFEMLIGGTPVEKTDFKWNTSLNFSTNNNTLEELTGDIENFVFTSTNDGGITVQASANGGYGEIWGKTYLRADDGRLLLTADGRPQATSDKVLLGSYQPDWLGGWNNNFRYKDFNLSLLMDARIGGQLYSGTDAALDANGVSDRTLQYRDGGIIVDGLIEGTLVENTNTITAQQYFDAVSSIPSNYIYDQTNIRMREAALTYKLPESVLGNSFVSDASIGLVGRNLFFISKDIDNFDPESSYSTNQYAQGVLFYNLPTTRRIGLNLNVKF